MLKIQLLAIMSFFAIGSVSCQVADSTTISNAEFKKISADKHVVILDVRTADEFKDGHIPTATNIDVLETDAFNKYIATLPKDKTYLLYCRSGKRSAKALAVMKDNGFANVKHLQNGFSGWDGAVEK